VGGRAATDRKTSEVVAGMRNKKSGKSVNGGFEGADYETELGSFRNF